MDPGNHWQMIIRCKGAMWKLLNNQAHPIELFCSIIWWQITLIVIFSTTQTMTSWILMYPCAHVRPVTRVHMLIWSVLASRDTRQPPKLRHLALFPLARWGLLRAWLRAGYTPHETGLYTETSYNHVPRHPVYTVPGPWYLLLLVYTLLQIQYCDIFITRVNRLSRFYCSALFVSYCFCVVSPVPRPNSN